MTMKRFYALSLAVSFIFFSACGGHIRHRQALYGNGMRTQKLQESPWQDNTPLQNPKSMENHLPVLEHRERLGSLAQEKQELAETVNVLDVMKNKSEHTLESVPRENASRITSRSKGEGGEQMEMEQKISLLRGIEDEISAGNLQSAQDKLGKIQKKNLLPLFRVRAKFLRGEVLFHQGEYDIAKQVYEDILTHDAFSGIVLKALERLIVCSEKLKLESERKKYHSILHNFFRKT